MPDVERPAVLVLMGGESTEHDVSLRSGAAVARNLPAAGYRAVPVVIGRDGRFAFPPVDDLAAPVSRLALGPAVAVMQDAHPCCAFIAVHGWSGEDGRLQALCDLMHVPHVGSDAVASAAAIDKWFAKCAYRAAGIPTPDAVLWTSADWRAPGAAAALVERLGLPVVVKTPRMGSSYGVWIARDRPALEAAVDAALAMDAHVLFEAFRRGRELTVPVLEDAATGEPRALPLIEIVSRHEFFDTESKYDPSLSDERCPAPIPDDLARAVSDLGVAAHRALRLSGFSRTDVIADDEGNWVLETNTIPGLTEVSLFPKAVKEAGGTFAGMLDALIRRAVSGR